MAKNSQLYERLDRIDGKLDNAATRGDVAALGERLTTLERSLPSQYVAKESFEIQHRDVVDRGLANARDLKVLGVALEQYRRDSETRAEQLKALAIEKAIEVHNGIEQEIKSASLSRLSTQDRMAMRMTQIITASSAVIAVVTVLIQHLAFK